MFKKIKEMIQKKRFLNRVFPQGRFYYRIVKSGNSYIVQRGSLRNGYVIEPFALTICESFQTAVRVLKRDMAIPSLSEACKSCSASHA